MSTQGRVTDLPGAVAADHVRGVVEGDERLPSTTTFQLLVDGRRLALTGTVDIADARRLRELLDASPVADDGVVLDLSALEFVDVGACRALARWALGHGAVTVRGAGPLFRRMWRLLGLEDTLAADLPAVAHRGPFPDRC